MRELELSFSGRSRCGEDAISGDSIVIFFKQLIPVIRNIPLLNSGILIFQDKRASINNIKSNENISVVLSVSPRGFSSSLNLGLIIFLYIFFSAENCTP